MAKRLDRRTRFVWSKCDRCGKVTPDGGLYVLDAALGEGVADQGAFCLRCATSHTRADWLEWLKKRHQPSEVCRECFGAGGFHHRIEDGVIVETVPDCLRCGGTGREPANQQGEA